MAVQQRARHSLESTNLADLLERILDKGIVDRRRYPRHLKGDDILMEARILAVADVVEAMASHRPYRATLGIEAALEEIERNRGTHYDNTVVDACLRLFTGKRL